MQREYSYNITNPYLNPTPSPLNIIALPIHTKRHNLITLIIPRNPARIRLQETIKRHAPALLHRRLLVPPARNKTPAHTLPVRALFVRVVHEAGLYAVGLGGDVEGGEFVVQPALAADGGVRCFEEEGARFEGAVGGGAGAAGGGGRDGALEDGAGVGCGRRRGGGRG